MPANNEAKKRDFVSQIIVFMEQNGHLFTEKGFDPTHRIQQLKTKKGLADQTQAIQHKAIAAAKDATRDSNQALDEAYSDASAAVQLAEGLLGKNNPLVQELKKIRN